MSHPTLRDVARKARLSVTQVSRALNDHDDVAPATKELARRVAAELNYVPNLDARRLQDPHQRSGAVGIVLGSESLRFSDPFFGDLLASLVVAAGNHGLQLQLSTPPTDSEPTAPYELAIRHRRVDGFVLVRTLVDDPRVDFLLDRAVPFVSFGRSSGGRPHAVVDTTEDSVGPAVDHLVGLGHRRIACLAEPPQYAIGALRLRSFHDAVARAASHTPLPDPSVVVAGFHEADGYRAAGELLAHDEPPTAIVALNDLLALGALRAAETTGVRVPHDLSVIGFDDIDAATRIRPALTTMRQPAADIAALLVDKLVTLIDGGSPIGDGLVRPALVVRQSTGPVPA